MPFPILAGLGMFLSGAMGAASSVVSANAARRQAEFSADQADDDALVADRNAALVEDQAASEERKVRVMGRKVIGSMRAGIGASGLQGDGSALEILTESAANIEADALNIQTAGRYAVQSYKNEATRKRKYADMMRAGAGDIMLGGVLSAGGQLLGGAAEALGKWPSGDSKGGSYTATGLEANNYGGAGGMVASSRRLSMRRMA